MQHQNSVFQQISKQIDWKRFDSLVDEHGADRRVRRLNTKGQFLALLFAQLSGCQSLREVETGLQSHSSLLYHCGATPVARSTLSDANAKRPAEVFEGLFTAMLAKATRTTRRHIQKKCGEKFGETFSQGIRLLDATCITLPKSCANWCRHNGSQCGAKVHVIYDPDQQLPLKAEVSPGSINEITPAKRWKIEPNTTYVFDMGYYDFQWWADLDAAGCRFVTRLKSHSHLQRAVAQPLPEQDRTAQTDESILISDRVGWLDKRMGSSRKSPLTMPLREVTVRIHTGKELRILTNDLDATAREVADLYKKRWDIELFFKWVKQNLKIKKFMGRSANAVRIQVAVAMITYLLIRIAHRAEKQTSRIIDFFRLVRMNLMHKKPINALNRPQKPPEYDKRQLNLLLTQTLTGQ